MPDRPSPASHRGPARLKRYWSLALGGVAAGIIVTVLAPTTGATRPADSLAPAEVALVARPAAVTGLSLQAGDAPGELHVSWDAHPQGVVDYRVKWAPAGQDFKKIWDTDWNAFPVDNELTISGLQPGESYKVQVRARFSGPNSQWSDVVTGTAAETAPEPIKVTELKLTDLSGQPAENSGPTYADAASVVWSATLTVGVDASQPPGSGYSRWAGVGDLSERGLTLGGTSMRVMLIVQMAGGLFLAMDRATDTDFTLTLGDAEFTAGESLVPDTAGSGRYWWATDADLWEVGEEVDASITAGSATLGERATAPPVAYFSQMPRPPRRHRSVHVEAVLRPPTARHRSRTEGPRAGDRGWHGDRRVRGDGRLDTGLVDHRAARRGRRRHHRAARRSGL